MPVQLSAKLRNALPVKKNLEDFASDVKKVSLGRLYGRMEAARRMVIKNPQPYTGDPEHHWPEGEKGKRARAWWFAALRDGRVNPPHEYHRTGEYADSWEIIKLDSGDGYMLRSSMDAAKWIAGSATDPGMQYHVHVGRWATLRESMETSFAELPKELTENVAMVARRRGLNG
jgi:hypothetical protein